MKASIDIQKIKKELVDKGLITQELCDKATAQVIAIEGEYRRDGSIDIKSKSSGVQGNGIFYKGLPVDIDIIDANEEGIKKDLQERYPDFKIWLKID